jgi:hypothetical protein
LALFEKKIANTLGRKETGSLQFIGGTQALCIFEPLSLQMILAAIEWCSFGSIQTLQTLYLKISLLK